MISPQLDPTSLDPQVVTQRRTKIVTSVLLMTVPATLVMAEVHLRTGFDGWKLLHLALFSVLFAQLAFGLCQAWIGYRLRRAGGDPIRIIRTLPNDDHGPLDAPTAVIMPICNEDVARVMAGVRAIYESIQANGRLTDCHFFILSDSNNPNNWVQEEAAWLALVQKLDAHGRIFYRKRKGGLNKKAGNVADFCRRWGNRYRYMVVLDADSIIGGNAVAKLVALMERNPQVGLVQAVPSLVNGETILARVQQFASRLYGPIFSAGLNYWQLGEANYWGHNAIIRLQPFIKHCSLPELPGDGPFGGRILSHDYVEAALMRRAGWQVWLAVDLDGNYEECPATLIDFAKRDRRWLQGNLQHTRLIAARGFHSVNRVHFILGILSYLASPLWLALVTLSCIIAWRGVNDSAATTSAHAWSTHGQSLALFGVTVVMLIAPKILALLDLRERPDDVGAFGGWRKLAAGIATETGVFTFVAPILMLFHSKFVLLTLCRRTISWGTQRRGAADEAPWREAFENHWDQTLFGLCLATIAFSITPSLGWWMSPLLLGLIFSIPLSVLTGASSMGHALKRQQILAIPEETHPPLELQALTSALATSQPGSEISPDLVQDYGLLQVVIDPYVNAIHASMLRTKDYAPPATESRLRELREKLLREGPGALNVRDRMALLSDADSIVALHESVWASPAELLAPWWNRALLHYQAVGTPPATALALVA